MGARTHAGSGSSRIRRRLFLARLGDPVSLATRSRCGLQGHLGFFLVETHPSFFEVLRKDLHFLQVHTVPKLILEFHDLFQAILPCRLQL